MGEIEINHHNVIVAQRQVIYLGHLGRPPDGGGSQLLNEPRPVPVTNPERNASLRPWIEDPLTTATAQLSTVLLAESGPADANHISILKKKKKGKKKKKEKNSTNKDLDGSRDYYSPCSCSRCVSHSVRTDLTDVLSRHVRWLIRLLPSQNGSGYARFCRSGFYAHLRKYAAGFR